MAETTIVAFSALPSCATSCGILYDVNGACVPPHVATAAASVYDKCFCSDTRLAPWSTGTGGVTNCDACTATPTDLAKVQAWYTSFCNVEAAANGATVTTSTASATGTAAAGSAGNAQSGGGGTWLDNHYQWVIFLVIMIVGIVGIWVGACIWRRRYLRKKDRVYALGTNQARATESGRVVPTSNSVGSVHVPQPGMFDPAPITAAGVYGEKADGPQKSKKKWLSRDRT